MKHILPKEIQHPQNCYSKEDVVAIARSYQHACRIAKEAYKEFDNVVNNEGAGRKLTLYHTLFKKAAERVRQWDSLFADWIIGK